MRVQTKPFGEIEVNELQLLEFPVGIFGFEELTRYVLLDASQQPFYWLQSLDRPELAFVLIDPRIFMPEYALEVSEEELESIGVRDPADSIDFVIVTVPSNPRDMTANLQGPIVVNRHTRAARQCISTNPEYGVRYRIMDSAAAKRQ